LESEVKKVRARRSPSRTKKLPKHKRVKKRVSELSEEHKQKHGKECRIVIDHLLHQVADEFNDKFDRVKSAYYDKSETTVGK
jgi:hypothetical protein